MSGRLARVISRTSRNPRVVTSAVCAPLRSVSALITTVVPWTKNATARGSRPDLRIVSAIPRWNSGGVEAALASVIFPLSSSSATRSVKVPRMSGTIGLGCCRGSGSRQRERGWIPDLAETVSEDDSRRVLHGSRSRRGGVSHGDEDVGPHVFGNVQDFLKRDVVGAANETCGQSERDG